MGLPPSETRIPRLLVNLLGWLSSKCVSHCSLLCCYPGFLQPPECVPLWMGMGDLNRYLFNIQHVIMDERRSYVGLSIRIGAFNSRYCTATARGFSNFSPSRPSLCDPESKPPSCIETNPVKRPRSASWSTRFQELPLSSER
jgi:hypothetical protein